MSLIGLKGLLADQTTLAPNQTGDLIKMGGWFAIMLVMMYVLLIAPQRKKTKELENLLKNLKAGDKIVTTSGIIGVVLSIKDRSVSIRSADTKLEILKSTVGEVVERAGETAEAKS